MKKRRTSTPAASIHEALRAHFAAPSWAYLSEVRNGTGWARSTTRTADALAFSLWPSRGLELHGIEIKSERSDWLHELRTPGKADAIGAYCDRFWLAIGDASVAEVGELPVPWGLLVFADGAMTVAKVAEKLDAKPLDRLLLAAIVRRAVEAMADCVPRTAVAVEAAALVEAAREEGAAAALVDHARELRHYEELKAVLANFERASGVKVDHWTGEDIGAAVRVLTRKTPSDLRMSYEYIRNHASAVVRDADEVLAVLPKEPQP